MIFYSLILFFKCPASDTMPTQHHSHNPVINRNIKSKVAWVNKLSNSNGGGKTTYLRHHSYMFWIREEKICLSAFPAILICRLNQKVHNWPRRKTWCRWMHSLVSRPEGSAFLPCLTLRWSRKTVSFHLINSQKLRVWGTLSTYPLGCKYA